MANNKEIIGRKSIAKRVAIATAITIGVVAGVGMAIAGFAAAPLLGALEISLIGVASGVLVGTTVGVISTRTALKVKRSKAVATKSLDEIRALNADKSSTVNETNRAKICRKFAKANLYLAKKRGGYIFGELHCNCAGRTIRQTQILNEIDAYTILQNSSSSQRERNKYAKKIEALNEKLLKMNTDESSSYLKWTQSFDDVVEGVSVLDRRTEIVCMTENARKSFIDLAGTPTTKTTKVGSHISVKYSPASGMRKTFANVEDPTKVEKAQEILIKDVVDSLKGKTNLEIKNLFPIVLETKNIVRDSAKSKVVKNVVFNNYKELKEALEVVDVQEK